MRYVVRVSVIENEGDPETPVGPVTTYNVDTEGLVGDGSEDSNADYASDLHNDFGNDMMEIVRLCETMKHNGTFAIGRGK